MNVWTAFKNAAKSTLANRERVKQQCASKEERKLVQHGIKYSLLINMYNFILIQQPTCNCANAVAIIPYKHHLLSHDDHSQQSLRAAWRVGEYTAFPPGARTERARFR